MPFLAQGAQPLSHSIAFSAKCLSRLLLTRKEVHRRFEGMLHFLGLFLLFITIAEYKKKRKKLSNFNKIRKRVAPQKDKSKPL